MDEDMDDMEDAALQEALGLSMQEVTAADLQDQPDPRKQETPEPHSREEPFACADGRQANNACEALSVTEGGSVAQPSDDELLQQALELSLAVIEQAPTTSAPLASTQPSTQLYSQAQASVPAAAAVTGASAPQQAPIMHTESLGALQQQQQAVQAHALAAALSQFFGAGAANPPIMQQLLGDEEMQDAAPLSSYSAPPATSPPVPQWAATWQHWMPPSSARESGAAVPQSEEAAVQTALAGMLGVPVVLGSAASTDPMAISLRLTPHPDGSGQKLMAEGAIDMAIGHRLQRRRLQGRTELLALADCHKQAAAALAATPPPSATVAAALRCWQGRLLRRMLGMMAEDDGEDLFFESGQHIQQFLAALGSGQFSLQLIEGLLAESSQAEEKLWGNVLRQAFGQLKGHAFTDTAAMGHALLSLDILTRPMLLQDALAFHLAKEAEAAASLPGTMTEQSSLWVPLLAVGTVPDMLKALANRIDSPAREYFESLRGYPERRGEVEGAGAAIASQLGDCYKAAHEIARRIIKPKGKRMEAVLAWLAAVAGQNEVRTAGGEAKGVLAAPGITQSASDRLMVGHAALALRLCKPFLSGADKFLANLDPHLTASFYETQPHRVHGANAEATLAGRDGSASASVSGRPFLAPDCQSQQGPHFVAECFFITQRALHVGLMPLVNRYMFVADIMAKRHKQGGGDPKHRPREAWLLDDLTMAQLMDPDLASNAVNFCVLEAIWLMRIIERGPDAVAAFRRIPQSVVLDLASWLTFVIRAGHAELVGAADMGALMRCITALLQRQDLVSSPLVHSKLVELLLTMLAPLLDGRRRALSSALGPAYERPGERALVASVLGTGATQEDLVPALMRAYADADRVVGLDVDKMHFDKFSMRNWVDQLLLALWADPGCKVSLTKAATAASSGGGGAADAIVFSDYVGAVLNSLMYLLKDSLERLADIHDLEAAMADTAAWQAQPPRQRQEKEQFYEGQGATAGGFMRMAVTTLRLLRELSADPGVRGTFLVEPILSRAAFAALHFLELLVGPKAIGLQVNEAAKYHFDPAKLIVDIATFMLTLSESAIFVGAIAAQPDYDEGVMAKFQGMLASGELGEYEHAARLERLIKEVAAVQDRPPASAAGAAAEDGANGLALPPLEFEELESAGLEEEYIAALQPLAVGDYDSTLPGAFDSRFHKLVDETAGDVQGKMKRLQRELRALRGKTQLPVFPAASVFLRHDSDRIDKMRALIVGPEGTPYAGGLFIFDIWFPNQYPEVPPLMFIENTGGGTARFNPNLYADGKVCLSLLGTWHGSEATEKWDPQSSSIFQVLLSIQGMIFVEDPYFNEPNNESMRSTAEGALASARYNYALHLNTIRLAMVDLLRKPPAGFEEVVRTHFRLLRHRIMKQCAAWLEAAANLDATDRRRLVTAVRQLHGLLAEL